MPFDPTQPIEGETLDAAPVRGNFNALHDLILALQSVTGAQVDSVTTLDPGQAATVSVFVSAQTLHLSFGIPRGPDGTAGTNGAPGSVINGAVVDSITSVGSADPASAGASYDGSILHFTFAIPRGIDGVNGAPGEVTNAALAAAVAGTSANSNAVAPLGATASPTYDAAQIQAGFDKMDELVASLRRV